MRGEFGVNQLILAIPSDQVADVCDSMLTVEARQELKSWLGKIVYPSIASIALVFEKTKVMKQSTCLNGFGYLVPSNQHRPILGCLFISSMFPHCCKDDEILLNCFMGGANHAWVNQQSPQQLIDIAVAELQQRLGIDGQPLWSKVTFWKKGIPQFTIGHDQRLKQINRLLNPHHIRIHANWSSHVAIGKIIAHSKKLAQELSESCLIHYTKASSHNKCNTFESRNPVESTSRFLRAQE